MPKPSAHPTQPHKYLRIRVKGKSSVSTFRWRCVNPGCHHYLLEDFIVGAVSECWRCGNSFTIDEKTKLMKPHCRNCTKRRDGMDEEPQHEIKESPI